MTNDSLSIIVNFFCQAYSLPIIRIGHPFARASAVGGGSPFSVEVSIGVGELSAFIVRGHDKVLYRKARGPVGKQ
jgi:hypothetical protein